MGSQDREQQIDQLLRGVYRICVNKDECDGCPFFNITCMLGEPQPKTWFDNESIEAKTWPKLNESSGADESKNEADDDSEATWLVSTSMGSAFTKYVFICSKCGYKKESMFSFTPMTYCPECSKKKNNT